MLVRSLVASALMLSGGACFSQAVFQQTIPNPNAVDIVAQRVHTYPDGTVMTEGLSDSLGFVLTRFDPFGVPIWRRSMSYLPQTYIYPQTAATPDGGLITVSARTALLLDSTLIDVAKIDASGGTQWARSMVVALGFDPLGSNCSVSVAGSGEVFIVAIRSGASTVTKLDVAGNELWSVRIWDWDLGSVLEQVIQAEPLADGGCVFLGSGVSGSDGPGFSLGRIGPTGNVLWAKAYTYNASGGAFEQPRLVPRPDQSIVVAGPLSVFGVGAYAMVARVDLLGQLVRADLYESIDFANWQHSANLWSLGNGDLLLTGGDYFTTHAITLRMDQNGTLLSGYKCRKTAIGQLEHSVNYLWTAVEGDTIIWSGNILVLDTIFGTESYVPVLWHTGPDLSDLCAMDPFTVPHYVVPSGVITSMNVGDTATTSFTFVPHVISSSTLPIPAVGTYCGLVNVEEVTGPADLLVWPNPIPENGVINFIAEEKGSVQLMDVSGRVLHRSMVNAGMNQLVAAVRGGTYCLRLEFADTRVAVLPLIVD